MIRRLTARHVARCFLLGAIGATLVGCGGSSGDDDPIGDDFDFGDFDPNDRDGNGIPDDEDENFDLASVFDPDDLNGNGVPDDIDDDFDLSDVDGDGIQNNRDPDIDGDGTPNDEDDDIDGDGLFNEEDSDRDGDGFNEATADDVCGDAAGTDADSSNFAWNDNCTVRRDNQFADSLYSAGVQRVVYCSGQGTGTSVDAFTDGEFGPGTQEAVTAYQTAFNAADPENAIGVDGQVGPQTWAALQSELVLVQQAVFEGDGPFYDGYGVPGERCGTVEGGDALVLFLNEVTASNAGIERMGWQLTRGATDATPVPFSTAEPFGLID